MQRAAPNLPLDAWSRVACHLSQADRSALFAFLRRNYLLPTYGTPAHTFCLLMHEAFAADAARECAVAKERAQHTCRVLVGMGFSQDAATATTEQSGGSLHVALELLLADLV